MEVSLKNRIVDHTTRMFARNGVKSVRMDDIAADMGISKRTIYETFGDKETLIFDCLDHIHDRMAELICEAVEGSTNVIDEFMRMLDVWDKRVDMTYDMINDVKKFYPAVYEKFTREHMAEAMETFKGKLQKGIDDGYLLAGIDLDLSLSVMSYQIYGVMKDYGMIPTDVSVRVAFRYVVSYFLRGIATLKGIEIIDAYYNNITSPK